MSFSKYSYRRELERFPSKYFFSKGKGETPQSSARASFSRALKECGLENFHEITYSTALPQQCNELKERPLLTKGAIVDTILARCDGDHGEVISAGIIVGDVYKKSTGKKETCLVRKIGEKIDEERAIALLQQELRDLFELNYEEQFELRNIRYEVMSMKVEDQVGSVVVSMNLVEHQHIFSPSSAEVSPFIKEQASFKKAKYVFVPFLYDATAMRNKGALEAPLAILDASTYLENYDIETDSQPSKAGIHTMDAITLSENPAQMIEEVREKVLEIHQAKKFPILVGGGHGISVGAFHAFKEIGEKFTVLQLDAHTALRPSFDGTPYSEACVMSRALECTDDIVQVGIRSISNREKGNLDFDKLFFASDIKASSDIWIDDVLEECGERVYVTLDADVFDPSIVHSVAPVPDGLEYHHVLKLLKKLIKTRKVIGIDINNLVPVPGMNGPEFTMAKLIYQVIAYLEKFSS